MNIKLSILAVLVIVLLTAVFTVGQEQTSNTDYTEFSRTTCNNGLCSAEYYTGARFAQNSTNGWVDSADVLSITRNNDEIVFHYNGIYGYKNLSMEVGTIYKGNYISLDNIKISNSEITFDFPSTKNKVNHKYSLNIDNAANVINDMNYLTLTYKNHYGFDLKNLIFNDKYIAAEQIGLFFDDLLNDNLFVNVSQSEKRVYIGNLLTRYDSNSNTLYLDPTADYLPNSTGTEAWREGSTGHSLWTWSEVDGTQYSSGELDTISVDDGNGVTASMGGPPMIGTKFRVGHRIVFNISEDPDDITQLDILVKMKDNSESGTSIRNMSLYVGNVTAQNWYLLSKTTNPPVSTALNISESINTSISEFVNNSADGKHIYFLLFEDTTRTIEEITQLIDRYTVLNVTYTQIFGFGEGGSGGSTCDYNSGDMEIDCSDHCLLINNLNLDKGANFTLTANTGYFKINDGINLTGINQLKGLNNTDDKCEIIFGDESHIVFDNF
ncbi:MAG: hypothetical protein AABW46_00700 [Nanoarchaeota archaeon]